MTIAADVRKGDRIVTEQGTCTVLSRCRVGSLVALLVGESRETGTNLLLDATAAVSLA